MSHVLTKCWDQTQYSSFMSGESHPRSRLQGERRKRTACFPGTRAPVWDVFWLQGEWEQELGLLHTYTGGRGSLCSLSASSACTSSARCMETGAKNTIIYSYKYPVPKISSRMSVRAELGARRRSVFGKRYFWTTCIHMLEYLLCKALCRSARH